MAYYVNTKTLAQIFDVSERRIQQLAKDGIITRENDGTFDVLKVIIEHYKNKNGIDDPVNYEIEHALLEKAKRETAEIELELMKNEVHKAEDIKALMAGMLITFRNKILAIPSTASHKLVKQKNPAVIIDVLTKELKIALNELSEYDPEMFAGGE